MERTDSLLRVLKITHQASQDNPDELTWRPVLRHFTQLDAEQCRLDGCGYVRRLRRPRSPERRCVLTAITAPVAEPGLYRMAPASDPSLDIRVAEALLKTALHPEARAAIRQRLCLQDNRKDSAHG